MTLDIVLVILSIILVLIGLIGCVVPIIPGPIVCYSALLVLHISNKFQFSHTFLIILGSVVVVISFLDYLVPAWGTKKFGGSSKAVWGSIIGLFIGLFFLPIGIIIGPFLGAFVFELLGGKTKKESLKSGFGAFLGFLFGVVLKLSLCFVIIYYLVVQIIEKI